MKKILAGFIMDGYGGGIDKYLLNFLENVHTENIRIDFLTNEVSPELETFLQKYHSRIPGSMQNIGSRILRYCVSQYFHGH